MTFQLNILAFHRIMPDESPYFIPPMAMTLNSFKGIARWLSKGHKVKRLEQVARDASQGGLRGSFTALTFDDGYLDNYEIAKSILEKYKLPATFFVPVDIIDESGVYWWDYLRYIIEIHRKDFSVWLQKIELSEFNNIKSDDNISTDHYSRKLVQHLNSITQRQRNKVLAAMKKEFGPYGGKRLLMNWKEIRQLHKDGFEIGSHTLSHIPLTDLSEAEAKRQVLDSRTLLSKKINVEVNGFCYPRGQFSSEHAVMAQDAGYSYAVTTRFGDNSSLTDLFTLSRRNMSDYLDLRKYIAVPMQILEISGKIDWLLAGRRNG